MLVAPHNGRVRCVIFHFTDEINLPHATHSLLLLPLPFFFFFSLPQDTFNSALHCLTHSVATDGNSLRPRAFAS